MKAITFATYGPAENLIAGERPLPTAGAGEVLIRVLAVGTNPLDARIRSGELRLFVPVKRPFVPGTDVAGVVEAVGPGAARFAVGDRVFAMLPVKAGGAYAEYATVAESLVARMPATLNDVDAAAVPLAALTALQALRDKAALQPGAAVLINGASGGVGSFAVQIARAMGARVTGAASGRNEAFVRSLGAEAFVDYTRGFGGVGPRFDVVFDAVAKLSFRQCRALLKPGGVAVSTNPLAEKMAFNVLSFLRGGRRLRSIFVEPSGADLARVADWIGGGAVRSHVERTFALAEAAEAHRAMEAGRTRGKLVLVVADGAAAA